MLGLNESDGLSRSGGHGHDPSTSSSCWRILCPLPIAFRIPPRLGERVRESGSEFVESHPEMPAADFLIESEPASRSQLRRKLRWNQQRGNAPSPKLFSKIA